MKYYSSDVDDLNGAGARSRSERQMVVERVKVVRHVGKGDTGER